MKTGASDIETVITKHMHKKEKAFEKEEKDAKRAAEKQAAKELQEAQKASKRSGRQASSSTRPATGPAVEKAARTPVKALLLREHGIAISKFEDFSAFKIKHAKDPSKKNNNK